MTQTLSLRWQPGQLDDFDLIVARFEPSLLSFTEAEALKPSFWDAGEDARLREDERFCPTPWRRWTLANRELINDALFARMQAAPNGGLLVADVVTASGRGQVFCPGDPRFVLSNGIIHLAGQRDLASAEGRERITQRLREARQRLFEATPLEHTPKSSADLSNWEARFVCLEAEAGGLHLEAGPLEGLPSFVKALAITAGPQTSKVLASNLRNRRWRIPVHPANEAYRWSAPCHENLLADELALLTKEGLPAATATVFRIDAAGVGHQIVEPMLNPGQAYRLLVPPALSSVELKPGQVNSLRGWRLWELEITPDPETELRSLTERLGVKLGESAPQAGWVITPPVTYLDTLRWESCPSFEAGSVPTLRITAPVATAEGDLTVFLLVGDELRPYNEQLRDRAAALFGLDFRNPAALAEALRCELSARGMASGRSLCDRAQSLLQPLDTLDTAHIRDVLDELAASGDATGGPGGMFAAAPLRVVRLAAGRYALHGTLPTAHLRLLLPLDDLQGGVTRYATVAADQEPALADAVSRLGGLVLSPRRWAGLDRVPSAGPEWLEELSHRLDQDRSPAGALDDGLVTPWLAYRPDVSGPPAHRWRSAGAEDAQPCLWRARHEYGWWRFAWTAGSSPGSAPHARLARDEACRTQFALDRQAGNCLVVVVRKRQDDVELEVDAFLPRAEYRYLTTLGKRVEADGTPRYVVPITAWDEAATTLQERLGIRAEHWHLEEVS